MDARASSRKNKKDALSPPYCEFPGCEYTKFFQRHRILPGRDGGKYKLGNVISLCPNHHAEADAGLILAESLLAIVHERIEASGVITQDSNEGSSAGTSDPEIVGDRASEESTEGDGVSPSDAANGIDAGLTEE